MTLDLASLPPRTMVLAHWEDDSQPDYVAVRTVEVTGEATRPGFALLGTQEWGRLTAWGAVLTVLFTPSPTS